MKTVELIGFGLAKAKPAGELKVGDRTIWNYGTIEMIAEVERETKKTLRVKIISSHGEFSRTMRKSRLVGITS